jgi:hypothetical protein
MNLNIVQLMMATKRDLPWPQGALQSAIDLELSTLPPYLCAYWCLRDSSSYPATQINKIFFQEMLHFGLVCNLLSATSKQPQVLKGYADVTYPGPLQLTTKPLPLGQAPLKSLRDLQHRLRRKTRIVAEAQES